MEPSNKSMSGGFWAFILLFSSNLWFWIILIGIMAIFVAQAFGLTSGGSATTSSGDYSSGLTEGDSLGAKEFVLTNYTPCTPEYKREHPTCDPAMQGDSGTANGGTAVYDKDSPLGFYVKYKGKKYYYTAAVPQEQYHPVLPFVKSGTTPKTGAYFDDAGSIFVGMDHFGSRVTNPKSLDILADGPKMSKFMDRLRDAGMVVGKESNGLSPNRPVVKGTLVEIMRVGSGN